MSYNVKLVFAVCLPLLKAYEDSLFVLFNRGYSIKDSIWHVLGFQIFVQKEQANLPFIGESAVQGNWPEAQC